MNLPKIRIFAGEVNKVESEMNKWVKDKEIISVSTSSVIPQNGGLVVTVAVAVK